MFAFFYCSDLKSAMIGKIAHLLFVEMRLLLHRKMPEDSCSERPLFGGAIVSTFPLRFQVGGLFLFSYLSIWKIHLMEVLYQLQDVSDIRQVPDHQVGFSDLCILDFLGLLLD